MASKNVNRQPAIRKNPCLWMQAGIVKKKFCTLEYNCPACRFDRALDRQARTNHQHRIQGRQPEGRRGKIVFWQDRFRKLPPGSRPCVHHLKRRIEFRSCTHDYQCHDCEFDQYFYDQFTVHVAVRPVELVKIHGFEIPQGYYLHRGHTWVKLEEGGEVRIGLDDFSLRILGPPDRIEAPLVGKTMHQNDAAILLWRDGRKARVRSPVSGVVTAINPELRSDGKTAPGAPYSGGWICRVQSDDLRRDLRSLMIGEEAQNFLKKEVNRLMAAIEETAGPLAADGGWLQPDLYGNMPELGWDRLNALVLKT